MTELGIYKIELIALVIDFTKVGYLWIFSHTFPNLKKTYAETNNR